MNESTVFVAEDNDKDYDAQIKEVTALFVVERLTSKTDY
jgi:hypothetical protein